MYSTGISDRCVERHTHWSENFVREFVGVVVILQQISSDDSSLFRDLKPSLIGLVYLGILHH